MLWRSARVAAVAHSPFCQLQLSGDSIVGGFIFILPGAEFNVNIVIDNEGNALATPIDEKQGQYRFIIYDQKWRETVYLVNCHVVNVRN